MNRAVGNENLVNQLMGDQREIYMNVPVSAITLPSHTSYLDISQARDGMYHSNVCAYGGQRGEWSERQSREDMSTINLTLGANQRNYFWSRSWIVSWSANFQSKIGVENQSVRATAAGVNVLLREEKYRVCRIQQCWSNIWSLLR